MTVDTFRWPSAARAIGGGRGDCRFDHYAIQSQLHMIYANVRMVTEEGRSGKIHCTNSRLKATIPCRLPVVLLFDRLCSCTKTAEEPLRRARRGSPALGAGLRPRRSAPFAPSVAHNSCA